MLAWPAAPVAAAPTFAYPWPDYSVIPVFFVPTDWSVDDPEVRSEAANLQAALVEIRSFYGRQNADWTFTLNPLQVVQASGPKEHYHIIWNGRNIYEDGVEFDGNMEHEVVSELHARGFPTPVAQNESGYSVLIFVKGAGGWAGAREFPSADGGWAILGDFAIDSINNELDENAYWWSGQRRQIGAAAHELGHTFDLPHPDAYGASFDSTILGAFWDYPTPGLNDWERDHLAIAKARFFQERLGLLTETARVQAGGVASSLGDQQVGLMHGSAASLHADDGRVLVLSSVRADEGFQATAYVRFEGVPNDLVTFTVLDRDRTSTNAHRSIEAFNEHSGWMSLADGTAARRELATTAQSPAGAPTLYVSGISSMSSLVVRVRYTAPHPFVAFIDQLSLQVESLLPADGLPTAAETGTPSVGVMCSCFDHR
jgi:hypothetical protein